jgi:hypothetical protein
MLPDAVHVSDKPQYAGTPAMGPAYKQIRDALTELATQVDEVKRSAGFTAALDAMSRFWDYSPFNEWLIKMQYPAASRVAGRRAWERLGRKAKPNARPILIFAPAGNLRATIRRGRGVRHLANER